MRHGAVRVDMSIPGAFNMAVMDDLVVFRTQEIMARGVYPEVRNRLYRGRLSGEHVVVDVQEMVDRTGRQVFRNYTTGVEDVRIYSPGFGLGVVLDTNQEFRIEMCIIRMIDNDIIDIMPLSIRDRPCRRAEKNWLLLSQKSDNEWDCLYSLSPLCIIRLDAATGHCRTIYEESIRLFDPNLSIHNGASTILPDGRFLVSARVKDTTGYLYSVWVVLSKEYRILRISDPFRFFENKRHFEMCMTIRIDATVSILEAFVSINDNEVHAITFDFASLMAFVYNMKDRSIHYLLG